MKIVFGGLRTHLSRGILTTLGITVGIVAVVGMGTMAYSLQQEINKQFSSLGSNTFFISRRPFIVGIGGHSDWRQYWRRKNLEVDYLPTIQKNSPHVQSIAPMLWYRQNARSGDDQLDNLSITASNENLYDFSSYDIEYGRFLSPSDILYRKNVCVIDRKAAGILFPDNLIPLDKRIKIGNIPFKIVGILAEQTAAFGQEQSAQAIVPYSTAEKYWGGGWGLQFIVEALPEKMEEAIDEVIVALRNLRGLRFDDENDFELFTSEMLMEAVSNITRVAYIVIIGIAAISLLVGGIGIMNVMFVSVTERTKEIGIRKSCGAQPKDILLQFGAEAIVLSTIGGIIGLILVLSLSLLAKKAVPFTISIPGWLVIVGILFSAMVGLAFGIFPAYKASRKNPVEALHYE